MANTFNFYYGGGGVPHSGLRTRSQPDPGYQYGYYGIYQVLLIATKPPLLSGWWFYFTLLQTQKCGINKLLK